MARLEQRLSADPPWPCPAADRLTMARSLAGLFIAGATLALLWTLVPHTPRGTPLGIVAVAAVAFAAGAYFIARGRHLWACEPRLAPALATGLISGAVYFTGEGKSAFAVLYVLVALWSAQFLSRRLVAAHVALVAAAYAGVLWALGPPVPREYWFITVGTLVMAAATVVHLSERYRRVLVLLRQAAGSDPLTGLANHGTFQKRLYIETARARRHGRTLALVLIDVDHFKRVNDTHGHQAGDRVLQEVARRLAAQARPGDTLARVGGEEFAWLLPESNSLEARQAAERARVAVAAPPFAGVGRMTISAGVCDLEQAEAPGDLYRRADTALYWAKDHGRDVVVRWAFEMAETMSAPVAKP